MMGLRFNWKIIDDEQPEQNGVKPLEKINWANRITLLRIVLTPLLAVSFYYGYFLEALMIVLLATITDAADGFIARTFNQKTWLGTFLDPVADKLLILTALMFLTFSPACSLRIPGWVTIIIVFRDAIIIIGAALPLFLIRNWSIKPSFLGKFNTVLQFFTVVYATIGNYEVSRGASLAQFNTPLQILTYTTLVFTIISGLLYLRFGARTLLRIN
ncbi:MAG: CDP-alcohol phosphatidyltransferase family protein [Candidatus Sumerlaeia bacterium]|nr:CDP-alcohol phosphatidyltransferase family protein [Candidatus Sumerlaeia bacterium]